MVDTAATQMPVDLDPDPATQIAQVALRLQYRDLVGRAAPLPELGDVEFRCYSQNGEDGILLYIFSLVGTTNKRAVEICAGSGLECNAANLIINHGWRGLLVDGDEQQVAAGRGFYARCKNTFCAPPTFVHSWLTAENVDPLVCTHGFAGEIDLLSLDIDGNDYWIWQALQSVEPRVVVLEFSGACGPDASLAMKYDPGFRLDLSVQPYRCGASLTAFTRLARRKGYRLVGVQSLGFNAFFVKAGVAEDLLPERTPRECYGSTPRLREWQPGMLEMMLEGGQWQTV